LEEAMKKSSTVLGPLLIGLLVYLHADTKRNFPDGYQTGTVVSVTKRPSESNYVGSNPSDAPFEVQDYRYEVVIRVDCNAYVGLYQSATNYVPSDFAPDKTVEVRLRKHLMYVSLPYGDWDVKMGILSHYPIRDESCPARS
jgi:hypothetical protein